MNEAIDEMGANFGKAKFSYIMPKNQAHLMEKYLRSLHYTSTGQWRLDGMKVPFPHDLNTGKRIPKP
ncbi:hypothetical protein SAMN04488541_10232 [Thermoflexibacter ruber]|uniref:Uncharacterized protein n=2 Tax=Thermoflexibacter ruber TaxID=1003 RepID=A0A1I2H9V5_9BACT|nr:hypothetical protein SAMN04488541_10232 [Thermoflexibacter ruber]